MENGYRLCFTTNIGRIDVKNVNPYIIPRNSLYDNGGYFENISKIIGIWQKYVPSNNMISEPEV
jgi:poly-beta-1,6-N-acetyl-D-glucosamine N-deacetylase